MTVTLFCRSTWTNRALAKRSKERVARDLDAIRGLALAVDWCNERGITVEFKRISNGEYDAEANKILVTCSGMPETQLHVLLHECGHHLFKTSSTARAQQTCDARRGTLVYTVNGLGEEFEAWSRGRRLAERLGISLTERYETYRIRCLSTYIDWARNKGKGYEEA